MEDKERIEQEEKHKRHPQARANPISKLFFWWPLRFFHKGWKKDLDEDDLYEVLKSHQSRRLGDRLEGKWFKELENNPKNASFWKALIKMFGLEMFLVGLVLIFQEMFLKMIQPMVLAKLMEYYEPDQTNITLEQAYLYSGAIVGVTFLNVIIMHSYLLRMAELGMKIRVACCSLIYRKALRLSKAAMVDTTVGQMVNLMSNDVNRFDFLILHIHHLLIAPLQASMVMYLLYTTVHPSALVGLGLLFAFVPLQLYIGKRTSYYRFRTAVRTDQRVRLMNEIITGIQVIKMYTWERPFAKLVEVTRNLEISQIKGRSYLQAINMSFMMFLNRAAIFLCVLTYIFTGNTLNAAYVYVITSYYGTLRQALTMFLPRAITMLAETNVSVQRIQTFLLYDEVQSQPPAGTNGVAINGTSNGIPEGVHLKDVCVKWQKDVAEDTLHNVTFDVSPGELVAIVGPVGSGKTTLLQVVLKEISLLSGSRSVTGKISYASQEPWLFAGSIRQNILFGETYEAKKYRQVVRVCALERDFSLFPYSDRTLIGERGVMLSGGQKARINLARAVYKEADIYLLDDPLSAVDTHVGKQLYEDCISNYLRNKATILVTHQLQYLGTADRIYLLENGKVTTSGSYSQLQRSGGEFTKLLEDATKTPEPESREQFEFQKARSAKSLDKIDLPTEIKEQRSTGTLSKRIYLKYLRAGGPYFVSFLLLAVFVVVQIAASFNDLFLNFWVNQQQIKLENSMHNTTIDGSWYDIFNTEVCTYIYSALIAFIVIMAVIRSMSFVKYTMKSSQRLHNNMFSNIVYTTMRFFNTNPSGRILNRFSKDMGHIDETLPMSLLDTIQIGLTVTGITVVLTTVNPWIIIPTLFLFSLFYLWKIIYLSTSRDLKRLEGTSRSPVFSHLTASLQGLSTIRAFNAQESLRLEFDRHQDLHSSAFYMFVACSRAFAFWLDIQCATYIGLVIFSFLFLGSETLGGNVGLAITQSNTLTGMLQWGMRQWSELENQMTSVERVVEYTELERENDEGKNEPPKMWPHKGSLEFSDVSMQYAPEEPFVLKRLTFKVEAGKKVGIVGRTGAGKSSLISALFRLAELHGKIFIDDVDTQSIPLDKLRSKISIIPQEPVLFSGSLRKNLDPFDEYDDDILWNSLEEVHLKEIINELPSGLLCKVSEGGTNFSVGQRQLLCLARAVIRSNKILILDEATANVDPQTDELIQSTIRRKFAECTVLTIAHRLNTVMDSDKILVMDAGTVAEFAHPHELLQNEAGIFTSLVKQTGSNMAENLKKIALDAYNSNR